MQLYFRYITLAVVAEAIGRETPVIVGPVNERAARDHPEAQASLRRLPAGGVTIVPPVDEGEGPRLAPSELLCLSKGSDFTLCREAQGERAMNSADPVRSAPRPRPKCTCLPRLAS